MNGKTRGARHVSEIANGMLDPILARRAGINTLLFGSWEEITGPDSPAAPAETIRWDGVRRATVRAGRGSRGVLTVACEGARALFLMHSGDR